MRRSVSLNEDGNAGNEIAKLRPASTSSPSSGETKSSVDLSKPTVKGLSQLSHFLHLDEPVPRGCNISFRLSRSGQHDKTGRPALRLSQMSPECGCSGEVQRAHQEHFHPGRVGEPRGQSESIGERFPVSSAGTASTAHTVPDRPRHEHAPSALKDRVHRRMVPATA